MQLYVVKKVPNGEDTVMIDKQIYVIRFSAKHAQHVADN